MKIDLTARGSGYYRVYVDEVEASRHITEREAIEKAVSLKTANNIVFYKHDYQVDVIVMGLTDAGVTEAWDPTPVVDQPPTITSTPSPVFTEGVADTYDMTQHVSDDGLSTVTYSIQNVLAGGLAFNESTGLLTYDGIGAPSAGAHTLTATDAAGSAVSESFQIFVGDVIPEQFTFVDQTGVNISFTVTSAPIQVTGVSSGFNIPISVTNGSYNINGGAYTTSPGTVQLNDIVTVQHTSSGTGGASVSTILDINGVQDTFTSTTLVSGSASLGTITQGTPLERRNIRWTFNQDVEYGAFVDGDVYIVYQPGLTITSIEYNEQRAGFTQGWTTTGSNDQAGSMVNPVHGGEALQGFSISQWPNGDYYSAALNIAKSLPYICAANQSIISTSPHTFTTSDQTYINDAEILTILPAHASLGDFRPNYSGTDKTIKYNQSQINYNVLANVTQLAGGPSFAVVEDIVARPHIDIETSFINRETTPRGNQEDYDAHKAGDEQLVWLKLNCNFTNAEKQNLATYVCQRAIDYYGVNLNGAVWTADGGFCNGRKIFHLIGGLLLGDTAMQAAAFSAEDQQFFNVAAEDVAATDPFFGNQPRYLDPVVTGTAFATNSGGTTLTVESSTFNDTGYNARSTPAEMIVGRILTNTTTTETALITGWNSTTEITHTQLSGNGNQGWTAGDGYSITELGMAEWGIRHGQPANRDWDHRDWDVFGLSPNQFYRETTSNNFGGQALALELMGQQAVWNNANVSANDENAFFNYIERFSQLKSFTVINYQSYTAWVNNMYSTYHTYRTGP